MNDDLKRTMAKDIEMDIVFWKVLWKKHILVVVMSILH